jgi:hypothetical protein
MNVAGAEEFSRGLLAYGCASESEAFRQQPNGIERGWAVDPYESRPPVSPAPNKEKFVVHRYAPKIDWEAYRFSAGSERDFGNFSRFRVVLPMSNLPELREVFLDGKQCHCVAGDADEIRNPWHSIRVAAQWSIGIRNDRRWPHGRSVI